MNEAEIRWSKNHYALMNEGGVWGVPRSGLVFKKAAGELILIEMMPHDPDMPITPGQLREQQESDYQGIKRRFEAAGIPVRREIMTASYGLGQKMMEQEE